MLVSAPHPCQTRKTSLKDKLPTSCLHFLTRRYGRSVTHKEDAAVLADATHCVHPKESYHRSAIVARLTVLVWRADDVQVCELVLDEDDKSIPVLQTGQQSKLWYTPDFRPKIIGRNSIQATQMYRCTHLSNQTSPTWSCTHTVLEVQYIDQCYLIALPFARTNQELK